MYSMEKKIFQYLDNKSIEYEVFEHNPVYTCKKMAEYLKTYENLIAKSMILQKSEGGFILAVLPGNMKIDYKQLAKKVGVKSISLAPKAEAEKIAGCSVGCVYPLGNLINLDTLFEKKLIQYQYVFFNPGTHTKSVKIKTKDLIKLISPRITEFSQLI